MNSDMNPTVIREKQIIDAKDRILGKLAVEIADQLRGKSKINFVYHQDIGNFVEVRNADKIVFSGNKKKQKIYRHHTGYIGHLKEITLGDLFKKNPEKVISKAVLGMLPKNRLRKKWMQRLSFARQVKDSDE